jgi:oligoribonuclease NrnB/cAMP/cGMP phosphodiesterase (DHH superfamily)
VSGKPLVIYHGNCQDGFTAAWAVWKSHPDWEFFPGKHGDPAPDVTGRVVYMVDFSYKRSVIVEMAKQAQDITILDHHKTAEADLVDLPPNVSVDFNMDKSGARLAWEHFHPSNPVPPLVEYVEDRDLWKFKYGNTTKEVSSNLFSLEYDFINWDAAYRMLNSPGTTDTMREGGQAILRKQAKDTKELLQNKFRMTIGGYDIPVCNLPYTFSSDAGHILAQNEPFGATFYLDGESAYFSLRSTEDGVDVSEVAKLYGGGGHKHAAGFKKFVGNLVSE